MTSESDLDTDSTWVYCNDSKNPVSLALGGHGRGGRAEAIILGSNWGPGRLYLVKGTCKVEESYGERGGEYAAMAPGDESGLF